MGFRIHFQDVDAEDGGLLRLLRTNPTEVFGRPYGGYLLFLAGAADKEIVDWLSDNMAALDSLTAEDVAFAIFAREFPVKLRSFEKTGPARQGSIGSVSLANLKDFGVSRVCNNYFGKIIDGEELTAITYAVDDVARGFGVLGDLPCVLVLDGVPQEKFDVIPLDQSSTEKLIPLLRKAITKFRSAPEYDRYLKTVRQVVDCQKSLLIIEEKRNAANERLEAVRERQPAETKTEAANLIKAFEDLKTGRLKSFRGRLRNAKLLDSSQSEQAISLATEKGAALMQFCRTIAAIRGLITEAQWPLDSDALKRFELHRRHAASVLSRDIAATAGQSREQCAELLSLLIEDQYKLIYEITRPFPDEASLRQKALEEHLKEIERGEARVKYFAELEESPRQGLMDAVRRSNELQSATLSKVFIRLAKQERLTTFRRQVSQNAAIFAGSIFKPDVLLKIWSAFA